MYFQVQNFVHNLTVEIIWTVELDIFGVFYSSSAYSHPKVKMVEQGRTDQNIQDKICR